MRQLWIAVAILGGMLALTAWNVTVMHQPLQPGKRTGPVRKL